MDQSLRRWIRSWDLEAEPDLAHLDEVRSATGEQSYILTEGLYFVNFDEVGSASKGQGEILEVSSADLLSSCIDLSSFLFGVVVLQNLLLYPKWLSFLKCGAVFTACVFLFIAILPGEPS